MALCSQAFTTSAKRSCDFNSQQHGTKPKRACLSGLDLNSSASKRFPKVCFEKLTGEVCYSSSSDSDNDSEDQQSCYRADQIKAKRRASSRVSFSLNSELSKAVSQYSDDEDAFEARDRTAACRNADDNLDCKLLSSPCATLSGISNGFQMPGRHGSKGSFLQISDSNTSSASIRKSMPDEDKNSRARCFDYLVGAIDEAWARYCDAASYVEDETYGYNTPRSVATDDEDDLGNTTDLTDYESDFEKNDKPSYRRKPSLMRTNSVRLMTSDASSTDTDPSSCQLQALKDRLIKAKYFLQDLVDSDDFNDASAFWKRWDMIKYATIELVEDDDEDEVIESTIDELEAGRFFAN